MCEPDFMEDALTTHNYWRRRHGVPGLRLNPYLCKLAQGWAVHLATTGRPMTSENTLYQRPVGENIAMKWANNSGDVTGREITDKWYSGITRYDFQSDSGEDTGQFTQLVWRDSEDFGIGKAQVEDGSWVVVANYYPSGNIVGNYAYNVRAPIDGRIILPNQTYGSRGIGQRHERPADSHFFFPAQRDHYAPPQLPMLAMRQGPTTLERARPSTTSTIYPYHPDQRDPYAYSKSPMKGPLTLPRARKSSTPANYPNSPADNPVTKMVKTQKTLDYHDGVPYAKTITTETKFRPDGSRSVVTTETIDPM